MGKNLHHSIRPFIERALNNHFAVESISLIADDSFFIYEIVRRNGLSNVIVVLSDDYWFGKESIIAKPPILKDGGFFLIARPEASGVHGTVPDERFACGNIGFLLGALNRDDFWNYTVPRKKTS